MEAKTSDDHNHRHSTNIERLSFYFSEKKNGGGGGGGGGGFRRVTERGFFTWVQP